MSVLQFQIPLLPASGSFEHDQNSGQYSLNWASWDRFYDWLRMEEQLKGIELRRKEVRQPKSGLEWTEKHYFVCTRQGTGGKVNYERKHPGWNRNIGSKRIGCPCHLTVKTYPGTTQLLGMYSQEHTHEIGQGNLKFQRLRSETRELIANLLKIGVDPQRIVN